MARKLRVEFPGAIYHVMNRGDRRESIFRDDSDRKRFLETLDETCAKTNWQVHAYCLMPNHFHLVTETPQANLVSGMKWLLGTYTVRFNRRHNVTGHLFSGRYKSQIVSGIGGYLRTVCDYVHLNPVRARLLQADKPLHSFRWSSLPSYLARTDRPVWLRVDRMLGECGIPKDSPAGRQEFDRRIETRRGQEQESNPISNHWCLGDDLFRAELLQLISEKKSASHYGEEIHEAAASKASRIVNEELKRLDWSEAKLESHAKGHGAKLAIARRLRVETTMTIGWIAERLRMGTKEHLSHLLYWQRRLESGREGKRAIKARGQKRREPVNLNTTIPLTDPDPEFDPSFD